MHHPVQTSERIEHERRGFFYVAAGAIAAIRLGMSTSARAQEAETAVASLPTEGEMPSLTGATEWINTTPLTPEDLRGKVVLVEFWTYTCINWLRSHAYVRAWARKYKEHGLVVIGAHTPEFPFEREVKNVRRAAQDMGIRYPIAVDSDYAIWRAFENNYWPAFYFVDAHGRIRHHQFGEGLYDQSERIIQHPGRGGFGRRQSRIGCGRRPGDRGRGGLGQPENP
jgi:thiol-disulfide isomerase/thioredoxin